MEQGAEKQAGQGDAPSLSAGGAEKPGQSMPSAAQAPTKAITTEGLHELQAGVDEPARAPVADASEWASVSDAGGATSPRQ